MNGFMERGLICGLCGGERRLCWCLSLFVVVKREIARPRACSSNELLELDGSSSGLSSAAERGA